MSGSVSVGTIRKWDHGPLEEAATTTKNHGGKLHRVHDQDFKQAAPPESWGGQASNAARKRHGDIQQATETFAVEVQAVSKRTGRAADDLKDLKNDLNRLEDLAGDWGFSVTDEGEVEDSFFGGFPSPFSSEEQQQQREERRSTLTQDVRDLEGKAAKLDEELREVLEEVAGQEDALGPQSPGSPG